MQDHNAALPEASSTLGIHPCYHGVKREMKALVEQAGADLRRMAERHEQLNVMFKTLAKQLDQQLDRGDPPNVGAMAMTGLGLDVTDFLCQGTSSFEGLHHTLQTTLDRLAGHLKIVP